MKDRISEQQFLDTVIEVAAIKRWLIHHDRPARTKAGEWRTTVQGHSGFPDLVLVNSGAGVLWLELKSATGKLTADQVKWLNALHDGGNRVAVIRPRHIQAVIALLSRNNTGDEGLSSWYKFEVELGDDAEKVLGPW